MLIAATAAAGRWPVADGVVAAARELPPARLLDAARFHRVEGCAHATLGDVALAEDAVGELARARRAATAAHLVAVRALADIAALLAPADIPVVVVKGPALSSLLYGDPGLRTYGDLDLLVPQQRFAEAIRLMESHGYRHVIRNWVAVERFRAAELTMTKGGIGVDVHWDLTYAHYTRRRLRLDAAAMIERARPVRIGGVETSTLDPVDTLVHLAVHAALAGCDRLVWFKDIERALHVGRPNLDEVVRRATTGGCGGAVGIALRRAAASMQIALPDDLVPRLAGTPLAAVDRLCTAGRFLAPTRHGRVTGRLLARSATSDLRSTAVEAAATAAWSLKAVARDRKLYDRIDPDNPNSIVHPRGDERDKDAFLDAVARW